MPDSPPLVSVVIPAYGVSAYIAETLTSALNQTFRDFEVIVVNDCCTDSENLNRAIAPFLPRIHYIQLEKNLGVSGAKNVGIQAAGGEWIAFLDGDDTWEPNYLEVQMGMLREHPEASLVYGNSKVMGSVHDGSFSQTTAPSDGEVTITNILLERVSVASMNVSRKRALMDAGLFDEGFSRCEDFDLWLRMILGGSLVIYHSQAIACYRRRDASLTTDPWKMLDARLSVLKKLEQDPRLSESDRMLSKQLAVRWTAEAELEFSKRAFAAGKREEALNYIASANAYYKKPKLTVVSAIMRHFPAVLRLSMRIRQRTAGF